MAIVFALLGDEQRARRPDVEMIWQSPERRTLTERADAASKAAAGGLPWRTVMADVWGFSPQKIARLEVERAAEALQVRLMTPAAVLSAPTETTEATGAGT